MNALFDTGSFSLGGKQYDAGGVEVKFAKVGDVLYLDL